MKYKLIKIACIAGAALSLIGAVYSLFFFPPALKLIGAVVGFFLAISFLLVSHYYNLKIVNLYFLPGGSAAIQMRKKKKGKEKDELEPVHKVREA